MGWLIPYVAAGVIGYVPRHDARARLAIAAACVLYPLMALASLTTLQGHTPALYDATLTAIDGAAGHRLVLESERLLRDHAALRLAALWVYVWNLPLAMLGVAVRGRRSPDSRLLAALAIAAGAGLVCYLIVPAVGPRIYWPSFPIPPLVGAGAIAGGWTTEFPNAMPSVHLTVTLLTLAGIWSVGRYARVAAIAYVVLTALATLGFGQHYVIDLVVAIPFAAAIWLGVQRRAGVATAAGIVTVASLLLIRLT